MPVDLYVILLVLRHSKRLTRGLLSLPLGYKRVTILQWRNESESGRVNNELALDPGSQAQHVSSSYW